MPKTRVRNQSAEKPSEPPKNGTGGRKQGYARVSMGSQDNALQLDALREMGCHPGNDNLHQDVISSRKEKRPGLEAVLAALQPGDTLVVWRLDRLGRSLSELVATMARLRDQGVRLHSLREGIFDMSTPAGKLVFHTFAMLAEFERDLIQERTIAGLAAARVRGRKGGRRRVDPNDPRVKAVRALHAQGIDIADIVANQHVSRRTVYRYLELANGHE